MNYSLTFYNNIEPFVIGGVASCVAETFTFPIDLAKTRLQIQGQKLENISNKYRGMVHCFSCIIREEGPKALYSGIKPAWLRQATYGTLKIGIYQYLKKSGSGKTSSKEESFLRNISAGMLSGAIANGLANPTDVLKVRMQSNQSKFANKSLWTCFKEIYVTERFGGLYRGVIPNAQRAAIVSGVELSTYDWFKQFLMAKFDMKDTIITHFGASGMAGFCASICATPIDVVKTRMMNQSKLVDNQNSDKIYKGSIDCMLKTVRNEGFFALYKGFLPSYLRLGPWNIIFFLTYEKLKQDENKKNLSS